MNPELDLASAHALFLAPGVGAQGATSEDVAEVFTYCPAPCPVGPAMAGPTGHGAS